MATQPHKPSLTGENRDSLAALFKEWGEPAYRVEQVLDWIWKKRTDSIQKMLNLSTSLRTKLEEHFTMDVLTHSQTQGSSDTTRKYLFRLADGRYVESVLIPASPALYGERADRFTLCVSSQVGCAFGCKFCASGLNGLTRNLTQAEIASQVLMAERLSGDKVNNIVFMGMGEPLANLKNLLAAIELITAPWALGIGARHLTISTSGVVPKIKELADHPQQIRLAISFHGATDDVREQIMPVNKKWKIHELFDALHYWRARKKQFITLEYILIKDVNDSLEQARVLAQRAKSIQAKVNLIPYNTVDGLEWERPSETHCKRFQKILKIANVSATLRLEKGHDIDAACGQLRLKKEKSEATQDDTVQS